MVSSSHFNKLFLTLAVIAVLIATGNALMCKQCLFTLQQPKAQQVCGKTVNCTSDYCFAASFSYNDTSVVEHDCDNGSNRVCPDAEDTCEKRSKLHDFKSCAVMCCKSDNCNNYTPSSASGFTVEKFALCITIIVGLFFA